jgi:hypothetical protein
MGIGEPSTPTGVPLFPPHWGWNREPSCVYEAPCTHLWYVTGSDASTILCLSSPERGFLGSWLPKRVQGRALGSAQQRTGAATQTRTARGLQRSLVAGADRCPVANVSQKMSGQMDYRARLTEAIDGFLERTPSSIAHAHDIVRSCSESLASFSIKSLIPCLQRLL